MGDQRKILDGEPGAVPKFTPPPAPTFTPPPPTFEPPKESKPKYDSPVCYYHRDEPAVAKCARCGKFICKDCFDNYGVSSGKYAGKALCYDCCKQLVAANVEDLKINKNKIMVQFIVSIIGMVFGLIVGVSGGGGFVGAIIGIAIGGVLLSALKVFFSMVWEVIKIAFSGNFGIITILSLIWNIMVLIVKCLFTTISNTFYYIKYLRQTSGFIESDSAALRQMEDYMEYTMLRNKNREIDLNTFLNQESSLANNSYAQMVRQQGEAGAEASMRECVATINENGEIIRSFSTTGNAA